MGIEPETSERPVTRETRVADLVRLARDDRAPVRVQHAAFATLVERFQDMALMTALEVDGDVESSRDACQEAFLAAWRKLPRLREPAAFGAWLKRLVRTQCARMRRRRGASAELAAGLRIGEEIGPDMSDVADLASRRETDGLIQRAVLTLPPDERQAVVLFYFLGEPLRVIADVLGTSVGTAGKRVFAARLRLRRLLPRSVTSTFRAAEPTASFSRAVRCGLYDEFVGEYRFPSRPRHRVRVTREGEVLLSCSGGQRNVLASCRPDTLMASEFDGEARFRRDRRGRISHFVYYEFGRRLGVAHRVRRRSSV
jgi:RNA polymerase sigma-70 factor (ECF subfamily)